MYGIVQFLKNILISSTVFAYENCCYINKLFNKLFNKYISDTYVPYINSIYLINNNNKMTIIYHNNIDVSWHNILKYYPDTIKVYINYTQMQHKYVILYNKNNQIRFPVYTNKEINIYHSNLEFKHKIISASVNDTDIYTIVNKYAGPLNNFYKDKNISITSADIIDKNRFIINKNDIIYTENNILVIKQYRYNDTLG
jgi:hypothetical protein